MQAIQLSRASSTEAPELSVVTLPVPKGDGDHVVVRIKATAMQPSDRLNARGGFSHTSFPRVPGRDFSGVITDGPSERVGQEVFGTGGQLLGFEADGTHAEYCVMHAALAAPKPSTLSHVEAAAVGVPFTTAALCLQRARAGPQDSVLVLGSSGSVGSAAVQVARALGCRAVYTAARRDTADINLASDASLESVQRLTAGAGVNVIIDTVGDLDLMRAALKQLSARGRYAWIAAPRGAQATTTIDIDLVDTYRRELELIGCNSAAQSAEEVGAALRQLVPMFEAGALQGAKEQALPQVTMEDAAQTYQTGKGLQVLVMT